MMAKPYPFSWKKVSDEEQDEYKSVYPPPISFYHSMIESSPMNVQMPSSFEPLVERIWNFVPRKDDIWIVAYPKSGQTLTQEIMWQIANGIQLDSKESQEKILIRSPWVEFSGLFQDSAKPPEFDKTNPMDLMIQDSMAFIEQCKSPRIIKSHLPMAMLPPNLLDIAKVLYVGRNPNDACVSFFHMDKLMPHHGMKQDYDVHDYATRYMGGKVVYGSYWEHINDGWKHRNHPNFKFLWYEDMILDLKKVIKEIATFTKFEVSDNDVDRLVDHCKIDNFKKNDAVNMKPPKGTVPDEVRDNFNFIRKGKVGDSKNYLTDESKCKAWNQWISENNTQDIPIRFGI